MQIDYCEEALTSSAKLASQADVKVTAPPTEVIEMFHEIVCRCTQRNYKKRCIVEEVSLMNNAYVHV